MFEIYGYLLSEFSGVNVGRHLIVTRVIKMVTQTSTVRKFLRHDLYRNIFDGKF